MILFRKLSDKLISLIGSIGIFCFLMNSFGSNYLYPQQSEMHIARKIVGAIKGRVWGPDNAAVTNGHVIVTNQNMDVLYGETLTKGGAGPSSGSYQITNLPVNKDLYVYTFHENLPGLVSVEKINLAPNEFKDLNILINLKFTDPGLTKNWFLRMANLLNQSMGSAAAEELKKRIQELSELKENVIAKETVKPVSKAGGIKLGTILLGVAAVGVVVAGVMLLSGRGKESGKETRKIFLYGAGGGVPEIFDVFLNDNKITFTTSPNDLFPYVPTYRTNLKQGSSNTLKVTYKEKISFLDSNLFTLNGYVYDLNDVLIGNVLVNGAQGGFIRDFHVVGESYTWTFTIP